MPAEQKRFRKRGGAKKKKKQPTEHSGPTPPPPSYVSDPNPPANYFSGFQEASTSLAPDLSSYIQKLSSELSTLDPDESLAAGYAANPSEDPPASVLLSRNALRDLGPQIYELAKDYESGRLVEAMVRAAVDTSVVAGVLKEVVNGGGVGVMGLACHRVAGRVLDGILDGVAEGESDEVVGKLGECVAGLSSDEIVEFMRDSSGSHVFRRVVAMLGGLPLDEPKEGKLDDSGGGKIFRYVYDMRKEVPKEWGGSLLKIVEKVGGWNGGLGGLVWDVGSCAALQGLMSAVVGVDVEAGRGLAKKCLEGQIGELMRNSCGGRFIERCVLCFGASIVEGEYEGKLKELARDNRANYCVQRILLGLKGRGAVMGAWDELEEIVSEMIGFGKAREGVVLALMRVAEAEGDENCKKRASRCIARACGAVGEKGKNLVPVLMMGCEELAETWRKKMGELGRDGLGMCGGKKDVLRVPREVPMGGLLGTLIARCVMRYPSGAGQAARDSLAGMSDVELLGLTGTSFGSRVVEQWLDGESEKGRRKNAVRILNAAGKKGGGAGILAVGKNLYGARVLLKSVGLVGMGLRKMVMEALASDVENLKRFDCGEMLVRKLRVEQYMRRGEEWDHVESARETRERMFSNILEDDGEGKGVKGIDQTKKKKKKKKDEKEERGGGESKKRKREDIMDEGTGMNKKGNDGMIDKDIFNSLVSGTELEMGTEEVVIKDEESRNTEGLDNVLGAIVRAAGPMKKKKKKKRKDAGEVVEFQ